MKLPSYNRLFFTDFPTQFKSLVEQLSNTINNSFDSIFSALGNNISLRDNLLCSVKDVNVRVNTNGIPTSTTSFSISNSNTIDGLIIIKAVNSTNSSIYPLAGIFISYTQKGNIITITNVTGLPINNTFNLRIVTFLT
jgi:hypothetical protein